MDRVAAGAAEWGIDLQYTDGRGTQRLVSEETLQRLTDALAAGGAGEPARHTPTFIWRHGRTRRLGLGSLASFSHWKLLADGKEFAAGAGNVLELPSTLRPGIFRLVRTGEALAAAGDERAREANLIVAPETAYQLDDVPAERVWILAVQLYAVRSRRNWGHGDFTDLLNLVRLAARTGAAGIGLNPLHALFDDRPEQASPYAPNSRLFLNPLYIDPEAVAEFPGLQASELAHDVARLRHAELVDYAAAARAKSKALRLAYKRFRSNPDPVRQVDFKMFRKKRGAALDCFAAFETLRRRFPNVWWEWPDPWRRPSPEAIQSLRAEADEEMGYYEYVQWIADRQLAACQTEARRLGSPVGLYVDLAVGVEPGGADAWSEQASIITRVEIGAPPDSLNTAGQAWGLAAFNPRALENQAFAPFARLLSAAMRHAGAIRLDHVLGLNRLYLIPFGMAARDGAYIRYPLQALLAVVALQSVRHKCLVIGEDLGTVPEDLRGILADWGIWSYLVMLFERWDSGMFKAPEQYRRNALATFSTHDLPTFTGWTSTHDLRVKRAVGLDPGETDEQRSEAHQALRDALSHAGFDPQDRLNFVDVARFLARTPSRLMIIAVEDLLALSDQPNIPGTLDEHPNWRRRWPIDLEDLVAHERLAVVASMLAREGRGSPSAGD